ncbi:MAG TPA: MarR family transcriptional regulator [Kofleriaceae bacterium]|nr:MarR family transcriptional regulator [Kofleriaceae bacterium]
MSDDRFRALLQELFRRFGLLAEDRTPCGKPLASSDAHALMILLDAGPAGMAPSALATRLGVDKSTATRLAARLAERGYTESEASASDARLRPIHLTRKGRRVADDVAQASRQRFADLLAHVPAARRAAVLDGLTELVAALTRMTPEAGQEEP